MSDSTAPVVRDRYLDTLRALAIFRVVAYHALSFAWFSFVFPSMGVMFALGGSLMARSVDRSASRAVRSRVRRLLPALWVLGAVMIPAMLLHHWTMKPAASWARLLLWVFPISDPPGNAWGNQVVDVLWYLRAYLWLVLLSAPLLAVFRRWPVPTILAPLVLILAVGTNVLQLGGPGGDIATDLLTYAACWLLGFAHRDGLLQRLRLPALVALAVAAAAVGAAWAFTHPDNGSYDLNEIPVAQAFWSVGFVLVLMRWNPRLNWLGRTPVLGRLVTVLNSRAVTVYLWHEVALMLSVPIMDWLGLYSSYEQLAVAWVLIGGFVLCLGWVEDLAARRPVSLWPGGRTRPDGNRRSRQRVPAEPAEPAEAVAELAGPAART